MMLHRHFEEKKREEAPAPEVSEEKKPAEAPKRRGRPPVKK